MLATQTVLQEAERNIRLKFDDDVLVRFYGQIVGARLELVPPAGPETLASCSRLIAQKDTHVLGAAIESGASVLLTLDRKHFMTPRLLQANPGVSIRTPGQFLRQWAGER